MSVKRKQLVIWGTGGHATSVVEAALASGITEVIFVEEKPQSDQCEGFPLLSLNTLRQAGEPLRLVVAVGDNSTRQLAANSLKDSLESVSFETLVHPSAIVAASALVGNGSVILQGAIIGAKCRIGDHCIINTGASLDHESFMGDFSSLAPGVVTGGRVSIGERSAIGIGAAVRHGVQIGQDTVVGSASYVHGDLPSKVVAYGTPAKVIRQRNGHDPYLS